MKTPSHAILNIAILARQLPPENLAIAVGAILPDVPIFLFYFWAKYIQKLPESQIWRESYWQPVFQNIVAGFHSIPLAILAGVVAYSCGWEKSQILFLSMVLHSLLDLPVHNDDAHRHFFPFSNYRFISPISYWDPKHYGTIFARVELVLVLLASIQVFPVVGSWVGKGLVVAINGFYLASSLYFYRHSPEINN